MPDITRAAGGIARNVKGILTCALLNLMPQVVVVFKKLIALRPLKPRRNEILSGNGTTVSAVTARVVLFTIVL
jgi:hypothetical protein